MDKNFNIQFHFAIWHFSWRCMNNQDFNRERERKMKHYLNVCDVNGAEVEPVDVITFGFECLERIRSDEE